MNYKDAAPMALELGKRCSWIPGFGVPDSFPPHKDGSAKDRSESATQYPLRVRPHSCHLSVRMQNNDADDRITSFLNLLLGIDSGAMVYLLITHYNPGGAQLPAKLPFNFQPPYHELSFGWQVSVLAVCAAAILIVRAIGLWKHQSQRYQWMTRRIALLVLAATLTAIGNAGYKIVKDPGLLEDRELKQKPNEGNPAR